MPLRLGTCSWSEKSWVGPFHPASTKPPWFHRDLVPGLAAFLARLGPFLESLPASPRHVLEVRNREFLHEELLAMLRERRVALCLAEVRGMPHSADVAEILA